VFEEHSPFVEIQHRMHMLCFVSTVTDVDGDPPVKSLLNQYTVKSYVANSESRLARGKPVVDRGM